MAPQVKRRRQPVSCENCRARKIRCTGGRVPCDSCIRRGFRETCYFLRTSAATRERVEHGDLVEKIASLERLLKQHIESSNSCPRQNSLPTPGHSSGDASVPTSFTRVIDDDSQPPVANFPLTGSLLKLPGGFVRFVPHTEALSAEHTVAFMGVESPASVTPLNGFPMSSENSTSRQTLLELFPAKQHTDELIRRFVDIFSPIFHILHDPTLYTAYSEFCEAPDKVPLAILALLFVVLAISILTLEENDPLLEDLSRTGSGITRLRGLSSRYRELAMKALVADQFMVRHNLYTVKSLVLLIYAMSHTDGPAWPLLGMTFHIATAIGCHIDPKLLDVDLVESEERRRIWAGLRLLYQNQATCMGNLLPNPITADVDVPVDANDEDITEHGIVSSCGSSYVSQPPTQMTYILYKFRLYKVATDVRHATLSLLPLQSSLLRTLDARIAQEEAEVARRFSNLPNLSLAHRAHIHILNNYTNQLYLILHRPYLTSSLFRTNTTDESTVNLLKISRIRCKEASMALMNSHQQLHEFSEFRNYRWYVDRLGSFNAFLGASTLIAVLLDPQLLDMSEQEFGAITLSVRSCADRLDTMSERSAVCAKASPILRRLLARTKLDAPIRSTMSTTNHSDSLVGTITTDTVQDRAHLSQAPLSPVPNDPTTSVDLDGWTLYPELSTMMTHLPPEQWLAPSSFNWNLCWNLTHVDAAT